VQQIIIPQFGVFIQQYKQIYSNEAKVGKLKQEISKKKDRCVLFASKDISFSGCPDVFVYMKAAYTAVHHM